MANKCNNPIIVGIDPGTTIGYAVLDLDGNILELVSSRSLDLNSLIFKVARCGNIVAVATDKSIPPFFIKQFASYTGAIIINPEFDLRRKIKRKLANGLTSNKHERDALASAICAYKRIKPFINKLEMHLKGINRESELHNILNLIITKKSSCISSALCEVPIRN